MLGFVPRSARTECSIKTEFGTSFLSLLGVEWLLSWVSQEHMGGQEGPKLPKLMQLRDAVSTCTSLGASGAHSMHRGIVMETLTALNSYDIQASL